MVVKEVIGLWQELHTYDAINIYWFIQAHRLKL
nr:MAG TPA: protein of unknown function (DUF5391) [Caudoviricetes sp.]